VLTILQRAEGTSHTAATGSPCTRRDTCRKHTGPWIPEGRRCTNRLRHQTRTPCHRRHSTCQRIRNHRHTRRRPGHSTRSHCTLCRSRRSKCRWCSPAYRKRRIDAHREGKSTQTFTTNSHRTNRDGTDPNVVARVQVKAIIKSAARYVRGCIAVRDVNRRTAASC
jgi:hypothetical protein